MFALSSVSFIGGENWSTRGHDRIVVGFVGILDTTLCDKCCQLFATGQWFSTGTTKIYILIYSHKYQIFTLF
jgi:hypothetical protein